MSEHIIYNAADGIATVTLNRPKVLNAINYELLDELDTLLNKAAADETLRVLLLTGSGKAFAAGADIAQQAAMTPEPLNGDNTDPASSASWNFSRFPQLQL